MALMGMSANRQCNSYFPGYHSPRYLVFGAEGSTCTSSNGNSERENDCYQLGSLPLSSACHLLGYNKELLKQTILQHEAIFRDQIQELHRIYQKQKELMDEIKRIELHKRSLRLETSLSSSSLYYSQNMPWLTSQSSVLNAELIQLPLASMQEKSRELCPTPLAVPAPTAIKESLEDTKLSGLTCRKVGKKILDLQLPADEYIDSEGESCENERVIKQPPLSTYTSNGISKVVYNTVEKPYRINSNGFADLNLPFKLQKETGVESDDFGASIPHRNHTFHGMLGRMTSGSHNFPNDVIPNLKRRQDHEAYPDLPLPNQGQKHGWLPSGQNGSNLGFLAKFNDMESQSVSIDFISKKLKQVNNCPCFHSTSQIVPGSRTKSPAGTHDPTSGGLLGPSYASCTCAPHKLVSDSDMKSSGISPSVLWKSTTSGPNLDRRNYLPPISAGDLNSGDNFGSSSAGHELRKYVKDSEYVGTHKSINLNIMPTGCFDTTAASFQSVQITGEEDKFQDSRLPWLKAKPVPKGKPNEESQTSTQVDSFLLNPYKSGCMHSDLMFSKVEKSDFCTDKTLAFDLNGKPQTSKVFQSLFKNHWIEEIKISNVNSLCDSDPDMGEQAPAIEHFMKNEKKHKHLAGILDLNSCMNEDENMPIDIDLQAPVSPENKECSPPRGESDENQLEMLLQLAGQEQEQEQEQEQDLEEQEDQTGIAAEALVSISKTVAYDDLQMTTCPSSESSVSSSLHWFSGIVSTIVDHSQCEVKEDFNCTIKDLEDFLPADFDYFEFMSLNLTETKDLDYGCYKSSGPNEQEGGSTSPIQPRKCRTNRRRHGNDFQSEILPSLASLSRYEVTEDLQTIGGLVEAARRTHSATGCLRSAGRNALAKGKRRSCASASNNITDLLLNLKEVNIDTEIAIEKMGFISWGKICRKPRGKRVPTRKPHLIFSQVHN
ncbi:hypothetical protein GLYMA_06G198000v4 [Glycine max]|uniref:uncharacterized protein isoform X2 n=1 Tax=Glycine max TaxID=3847 RepID=UPI00023C2C15|nr:uncharacterized protein LOC102666418 isoform X2 [Glycine max]KRH54614.2 hypothetical protein GLYMA_06G198000v4 [Glycine max]|eukprot:XP_006581984.1 uncharacterized protein LOC102666418 isoform X2 [Glycine max]